MDQQLFVTFIMSVVVCGQLEALNLGDIVDRLNQDLGSRAEKSLETRDVGSGNGYPKNTCTPEYRSEYGHTMCMNDNRNVVTSSVSAEDQKTIVDFHNDKRAHVDPPATDMPVLVWDDELAAVASKWSRQCRLGHDRNRKIPAYGVDIGQNVAAGQNDWTECMTAWYDEVKDYQYGSRSRRGVILHYTQFVYNATYRIGCGFSDCKHTRFGKYYVCNYATRQLSSHVPFPYTSGERCSACPNNCKDGLCDCKGKMCLNGGSLDINTCTCSCPSSYKGDDCTEKNCPKSDPKQCNTPYGFSPSDCKRYTNVPEECPRMCGFCGNA